MDDIVKQAINKWPNVPACYGWLALDARGGWRMRDETTQRNNLPGDKIMHTALVGFINRNYSHDEQGCWYFQNGPQRVYVDLALTPYIVRSDPAAGWLLHTGEAMPVLTAVMLTPEGQPILLADDKVAAVDDRDMAEWLRGLRINGAACSDDNLMLWLDHSSHVGAADVLTWQGKNQSLPVQRLTTTDLGARFSFITHPRQP
ncbi:DUF2946 family protein [Glaciimonas soli]|uniref:DUF2946 family protein n=1 Tax=Glaciimonas soli TaxID=2590999 RepID=A0A843YW42_9BURK|nr:DUF2946 family protein [Glaciimonas soli]MQR01903.1 DUF2946 family protein [Glaciimonas soli]